MAKKLTNWILLGLASAAILVSGCGGGSAGGGTPGSGITTLRVRVVTELASNQLAGVAGAEVYAVLGTGQGAQALRFTVSQLDNSVHELIRPPTTITGLFVVAPQGYHQVIQYPYVPVPNANNYQMPTVVPFDTAIYAVPSVTPPFDEGIVEIGPARLYPTNEPPPQPNFP